MLLNALLLRLYSQIGVNTEIILNNHQSVLVKTDIMAIDKTQELEDDKILPRSVEIGLFLIEYWRSEIYGEDHTDKTKKG